jgi:hypothetical protein
MKKVLVLLLILGCFLTTLSAQTHNSVSLDETQLYDMLEMAEIRGLIRRLPSARPYALSLVAGALEELSRSSGSLSRGERQVLDDYIERFAVDLDKPFLQDGDLRVESEVFPLKAGVYTDHEFRVDLASLSDWGMHNIIGLYALGDMGKHISYGLNINFQINQVALQDGAAYPYAWDPYTYSKVWDGGSRYLSNPDSFKQMPLEMSFGWAMYPEIAASFWDNKLDLRFGRIRHDWGLGEGNLFLDKQARPFVGFDGTASPWKWLSFSFLFGGLEYGETFRNNSDFGIKTTAETQQNMYSVLQLEIAPTKWLYFSIFDAAVYLKRQDLGYMHPFMSQLFNQNNVGDFDNLMFGGTLALSWPEIFRTYFTIYLDELQPSAGLDSTRNQVAFQTGIKAPVPGSPWSMITFQYSKIEPFTYSHYYTAGSPWYSELEMETGYQNNGENLGSNLEPNADEFLLSFKIQPAKGWSAIAGYRLIRHGKPGSVVGSTYDPWGSWDDGSGGPDGDPDGAYHPANQEKNFLKDGIYEWFHVLSLGGQLDLRNWNFPAQVGLSYSLVYEYDTDFSTNGNYNPLNGSSVFRHLVGITSSIWPY